MRIIPFDLLPDASVRLKKFSGIRATVEGIAESEPRFIADEILMMLGGAGWSVPAAVKATEFGKADKISVLDVDDISSAGISVGSNESITQPDANKLIFVGPNPRLKLAALALVEELKGFGIVARYKSFSLQDDSIRIFVGLRPGPGEAGAEYNGSAEKKQK